MIPPRLAWAVDLLAVKPADRVLEIGCGRGVALEAIAERLRTGSITGIDRSAKAIEAARVRNARSIRAGKARLLHGSVDTVPLEPEFDKAFAVNVNSFWRDPGRDIEGVRRVLRRRGRLLLVFEPPSPAQIDRIVAGCSAHLAAGGFTVESVLRAELGRNQGVCLVARPAGSKKTVRLNPSRRAAGAAAC